VQARGVDKEGRDCTTPKHKFSSRKGANADPVVLVDAGVAGAVTTESDGNGRSYEVGHALWRSRSYDPDFDNPFVRHDWTMTLPGADGKPVVVASLLDGVATNADLDNDGVADIEMVPTKGAAGECTIRFVFRNVEHDPTVMYDLHYTGSLRLGGRKGWDGCIYGNRPPGNK
jgi:hypothetical protein